MLPGAGYDRARMRDPAPGSDVTGERHDAIACAPHVTPFNAVAPRSLIASVKSRRHERWDRARLEAHQARALARVRADAVARSPFYAERYRAYGDAPFAALPSVSKTDLMARFDDAVTDRRIRFDDVQRHMVEALDGRPYLGRYRILSTSGTTGVAAVTLQDDRSFASYLATFIRAREMGGAAVRPWRRTRAVSIGSTSPWKVPWQVRDGFRGPWALAELLLATEAVDALVVELNRIQPEEMTPVTSVARRLTEEQLAGRLRISPRRVMLTSDVLTQDTRDRIRAAWGREPFDLYATTETGVLAAECVVGRRKHVLEDLTLVEVVDDDNQPVPAGTWGAKVLVTPLVPGVLPLIRYELSDLVRLSDVPCPCGRSLAILDAIQGRAEERLLLARADGEPGTVAVEPSMFHVLLDGLPVAAWQVRADDTVLTIVLARPSPALDIAELRGRIERLLESQGARPASLHVRVVDEIERTTAGKLPAVRIDPAGGTPGDAGARPD